MDSDDGKLFLGGIAWETTEERLSDYFGKYGDVSQIVIMRDKITGRPRGFGFVLFSDPSVLDSVLQDKHAIDGRNVEAKRALSREEQQASKPGNNGNRSSGGAGNYKTKKIFVGGLPSTLNDEQFRQYFETYGNVTDVVIMFDQTTNRPRGFGFISFDTEDAVDRVVQKTFHELNNKLVEVKRALPKDTNHGGGGGGGYQGNGGYGGGAPNGNGGYPAYSGYGQPGYGYSAPNGYGGANGGYGGANGGYGGVYGNPGALKSSWGGQIPGYGGSGYGSGGPAPVAVQSPNGASGYVNQGYGYGNYGTNGGYNTNSGGYEAAGGANGGGYQQTAGQVGYMAAGGGQPGYSNAAWRSNS